MLPSVTQYIPILSFIALLYFMYQILPIIVMFIGMYFIIQYLFNVIGRVV